MRRRDLVIVGSVGAFGQDLHRHKRRSASDESACFTTMPRLMGRDSGRSLRFEELLKFGWADGGNMRIEYRSAAVDADLVRAAAREMLGLNPAVI
jgi:hypothetical protein